MNAPSRLARSRTAAWAATLSGMVLASRLGAQAAPPAAPTAAAPAAAAPASATPDNSIVPAASADWAAAARDAREAARKSLHEYAALDGGKYQIPIEHALELLLKDPALLAPQAITAPTGASQDPVARGEFLFTKVQPCGTCHTTDGTPKIGPTLKGVFGSQVKLADGSTVTADEAYLRESIKVPTAKIVQGFAPLMPPLPIADGDVDSLVAYLKSLK